MKMMFSKYLPEVRSTQIDETTRRKGQKGFSLIELMVVLVILGILAYVVMTFFGGGTNAANAQAVRSASNTLIRGVGFLNTNLGTGTVVTASNPLTATGKTMLDVLVKGRADVAAAYQARFDSLGMRPMNDKITGASDSAGYQLMTYTITMIACPSTMTNNARKVCVQYGNVPTEVLTEVALKENVTAATTAAHAGADSTVHWTAPVGGMHTVTMAGYP